MRDTPRPEPRHAERRLDISGGDSTFVTAGRPLGNEEQTDFSALLLHRHGVKVERVTIDHDEQPFSFSGAWSCTAPRVGDQQRDPPQLAGGLHRAGHLLRPQLSGIRGRGRRVRRVRGRGVIFNALGPVTSTGSDIAENDFDWSATRRSARAVTGHRPGHAAGRQLDLPPHHHEHDDRVEHLPRSAASFYAVVPPVADPSAVIVGNRFEDVAGTILELRSLRRGTPATCCRDNDIQWRETLGQPAVTLHFNGSSTTPDKSAFGAQDITGLSNRIRLEADSSRSCGVSRRLGRTGRTDARLPFGGDTLDGVDAETCGPQADDCRSATDPAAATRRIALSHRRCHRLGNRPDARGGTKRVHTVRPDHVSPRRRH